MPPSVSFEFSLGRRAAVRPDVVGIATQVLCVLWVGAQGLHLARIFFATGRKKVGRLLALHPVLDGGQRIEVVQGQAFTAVGHAGHNEQARPLPGLRGVAGVGVLLEFFVPAHDVAG